jgi:hypothetical protein
VAPPKQQSKHIGITHHPLDAEEDSQQRVPARSQAKRQSGVKMSGTSRGHRLSRQAGHDNPETDGGMAKKSGKGGKTGGSRAGLLSASRKVDRGK